MSLASRVARRERGVWVAAVLLCSGIAAAAATQWAERRAPRAADLVLQAQWQAALTQHAIARTARSDAASAAPACRTGAFVEAAGILNSVALIAERLPPQTPERTRAELDTVLFTALRQARAEVHCVAGRVAPGYERSYAQTIERAGLLARQRGLHPDVSELAQQTAATLLGDKALTAAR
jgi:hypothetical protein